MKNLKYIALLCVTVICLTSCGRDFLEPEVKNYITEEEKNELQKDPKTLANLVTASIAINYNTLQGFWASHDDFGLRAFQLATDMMTADIAYYGGWFQYDYKYGNFEANYRRTNSTWGQWYDVVAKVNVVLRDFFPGDTTDPALLASKATPLALRGIAYYHLANFYQATYIGHEDKMGVPLPLKPEDENFPRATLRETYARIVDDLSTAVKYGSVTPDHTDVDKSVAAAYLAKAYADMKQWDKVEEYAKIAQEGAADAVLAFPPSWNVGNGDVLWGFDVTPITSTLWASFYSHMDPTLKYYAGGGQEKYIYNWLYAQMGKKDVRKSLFIHNADNPEIAKKLGFENYVDKEGKEHNFDYIAVKFKTKPDEAANTDYVYLRVQDPILLEIEALVEQNKLPAATAKLKAFMTPRDEDFKPGATQEELRKQVRIQRRIELWGEGTAWFDLRRWNEEVDRTLAPEGGETNHGYILKKNLNDIENIHKIPQREINNNKNLKQNDEE
ncbi:RagB/SusD family nutrient uptake outer membrane protein [Porphyromonas macacae]|uniref:RagB/SusD family nutrient uptake outer membrane protein n=1 Tax=Porphyromonas macacae TaxID=28115 RepID=UPI00359FCFE6